MFVKVKIAKWQGPVIPQVRHEPAQIVQDVPPLDLASMATMAGIDQYAAPPFWLGADVAGIEARVAAWAAENGMRYNKELSIHDEMILEPIAAECDAERM